MITVILWTHTFNISVPDLCHCDFMDRDFQCLTSAGKKNTMNRSSNYPFQDRELLSQEEYEHPLPDDVLRLLQSLESPSQWPWSTDSRGFEEDVNGMFVNTPSGHEESGVEDSLSSTCTLTDIEVGTSSPNARKIDIKSKLGNKIKLRRRAEGKDEIKVDFEEKETDCQLSEDDLKRRQIQKEKNKQSAQRSRDKRKQEQKDAKEKNVSLTIRNSELKRAIRMLKQSEADCIGELERCHIHVPPQGQSTTMITQDSQACPVSLGEPPQHVTNSSMPHGGIKGASALDLLQAVQGPFQPILQQLQDQMNLDGVSSSSAGQQWVPRIDPMSAKTDHLLDLLNDEEDVVDVHPPARPLPIDDKAPFEETKFVYASDSMSDLQQQQTDLTFLCDLVHVNTGSQEVSNEPTTIKATSLSSYNVQPYEPPITSNIGVQEASENPIAQKFLPTRSTAVTHQQEVGSAFCSPTHFALADFRQCGNNPIQETSVATASGNPWAVETQSPTNDMEREELMESFLMTSDQGLAQSPPKKKAKFE